MENKPLTDTIEPTENQDAVVAALAEKWRDKKGSLIMALHDVQRPFSSTIGQPCIQF